MSLVTLDNGQSPFSVLLNNIGQDLAINEIRYMKFLLQGHIRRETLEYLESGPELTEVLRNSGLVSERRLAFMRKLLIEAKCLKLVHLLDEYKEMFAPQTAVGEKEQNDKALQQNNKREVILRMIERVENEIKACEGTDIKLKNAVKDNEFQIKSSNGHLAQTEEDIVVLKSKRIVELESQIESYDRKLETARFFIKKHQVEIDQIKLKLKDNSSSATLKMNHKEKQGEYEKNKRSEDELLAKRQKALEGIRTVHVEIRYKTQEAIGIEDQIHDAQMDVRKVKHDLRKNQRTLIALQEKLETLCVKLDDTNRQKPFTPFSVRSRSRMTPFSVAISNSAVKVDTINDEPLLEYKLLDYGELTEREATVIGRKGKRISPPQFNSPTSLALDRMGQVYVADCGNARIHILDARGKVAREPLHIGGKCRPRAVAATAHGELVMTDSQIIRIYNRTGEPLRPILPVYSKNDRRPELSAVALDTQGNIYVTDKANHRIQKFSFDGNFLCFIGSSEDLHKPMGIVVTSSGNVIVSEFDRHCLKIFARKGLVQNQTIGTKGIGLGKFMYPRGLALDRRENILIADSHNHRIHVITCDGEFVGSFGTIGSDPGCLDTPYDVAVDACGNVIVADTKNHRIQTFTRLVPLYADPVSYEEENEIRSEQHEDEEVEDGGVDNEEFQESRIENEDITTEGGNNQEIQPNSCQLSGDGKDQTSTARVESTNCSFINDNEQESNDSNNNNLKQGVKTT